MEPQGPGIGFALDQDKKAGLASRVQKPVAICAYLVASPPFRVLPAIFGRFDRKSKTACSFFAVHREVRNGEGRSVLPFGDAKVQDELHWKALCFGQLKKQGAASARLAVTWSA